MLAQFGPMIAKTRTLPGNHGTRLDKGQSILLPQPAACDPRPETVPRVNPWALGGSLIHRELMFQRDDLELQREPTPKQGGHKGKQRAKNWLHDSGSSSVATIHEDSRLTRLLKKVENNWQYEYSERTRKTGWINKSSLQVVHLQDVVVSGMIPASINFNVDGIISRKSELC